jgi:hypothetical protein
LALAVGWAARADGVGTDNDGAPESAVDRDRMLANISL